MKLPPRLRILSKELQFRSPMRRMFFPRWRYMFTPQQLCRFGSLLEETKGVPGSLLEIGCAIGHTTIFLNKYLDELGIERSYYAIDTFSGFVESDLEYEMTSRGKAKQPGMQQFFVNDRRWFDQTMTDNGIRRVTSIEADITKVDLAALGPFSFVLLDVDLYLPTKATLPKLYENLSPGGVIVVDDCDAQHKRWDGAFQALVEFMEELGEPPVIELGKLGVIRKQ